MMMIHTAVNCRCDEFALLSSSDSPVLNPLVVIGSGSSLDGSLSDLSVLQNRCILISAGSSLATLLRAGIRPHFHENEDEYLPATESQGCCRQKSKYSGSAIR